MVRGERGAEKLARYLVPPKIMGMLTGIKWATQAAEGGPVTLVYEDGTEETGRSHEEVSEDTNWFSLVSEIQSQRRR